MTTKSYNCANQIGPGTDPIAFNFSGAFMFGPVTAQGFLQPGIGLSAVGGPGTYTLSKDPTFGFDVTSDSFFPNPLTMTKNLTAINIGAVTCVMPSNPRVGDTYRFVGADIHTSPTIIQMANVNQRAFLTGLSTSGGGTITANGEDVGITLVCCFVSGATVNYVCYDVVGSWILS